MLHGYYADAAEYERSFSFEPIAEQRGLLYCYPQGIVDPFGYGTWTGTDASGDFYNAQVDDAGFLRDLIGEVSRRLAVDRKRVYLVGIANGGFMAYRMACQEPQLIAGIASISGATFLDSDRYTPSEPVNILQVHGTAEEEIFYDGGAASPVRPWPLPSNMPPYPGAERTIQIWAAYNGAHDPVTDPVASMDLALSVPGLETVVTRYTSYPPGGAVELWSMVKASHQFKPSSEFSRRIIDWLLSHPKP